ncbi:MAG: thioredoxin family protein, partial [Alphaproteobacteria bacterium]
FHWPAPERFSVLGLETLGYKDAVVFPLRVRPLTIGDAVTLAADVRYLACDEVCIPRSASLSLHLPAAPADPGVAFRDIGRAEARLPVPPENAGLTVDVLQAVEAAGALRLQAVVRSATPLVAPDLFVEGLARPVFSRPDIRFGEGRRSALLELDLPAGALADDATLFVTMTDGGRAVETERQVVLAATPVAFAGASLATALPGIGLLAIAFLGGLILNLMPCVLPVLSIKVAGVARHGGGSGAEVRASFLATAAGIVLSFLALAGLALGLRQAGLAVGWGIQFQQPLFLIAMAVIVTLFAANLWGLFEIRLPGGMSGAMARAGGKPGLVGDTATGAFATLLATPCSAPFVGTALGFALSGGAATIFPTFFAMGLGLATPYLLVAALPRLVTALPKPGAWMVWLRRIMAVALAVTAAWLLSVLQAQAGPLAAIVVTSSLMVMVGGLALWRWFAGRDKGRGLRLAAVAVAAIGLAGAFAAPTVESRPAAPPTGVLTAATWQSLDLVEIRFLVAEGKLVLVDVTADWCITCQVNKATVLDRSPIVDILADGSVTAMRADWTSPNPAVSDYLASFGRYGIPFNAVYGPGAPDGLALPELLTPGIVTNALAEAAGG